MRYEYMTYHITKDEHGAARESELLERHAKVDWELVAVTPYCYNDGFQPDGWNGVIHYYRRPL